MRAHRERPVAEGGVSRLNWDPQDAYSRLFPCVRVRHPFDDLSIWTEVDCLPRILSPEGWVSRTPRSSLVKLAALRLDVGSSLIVCCLCHAFLIPCQVEVDRVCNPVAISRVLKPMKLAIGDLAPQKPLIRASSPTANCNRTKFESLMSNESCRRLYLPS